MHEFGVNLIKNLINSPKFTTKGYKLSDFNKFSKFRAKTLKVVQVFSLTKIVIFLFFFLKKKKIIISKLVTFFFENSLGKIPQSQKENLAGTFLSACTQKTALQDC